MKEQTAITATRRIQFCCGHRVVGHEGKCKHVHGHNYVALVTAVAEINPRRLTQLDDIGRVVDFSVLKDRVGGWIDQHWDHKFVAWDGDDELRAILEEPRQSQVAKLFRMFWLPLNPTAENMARYLLEHVGPAVLADTGVGLVSVRLWETENCYADATS